MLWSAQIPLRVQRWQDIPPHTLKCSTSTSISCHNYLFSNAEPDTCRIGVSLLLHGGQHTGGIKKKAKGGFEQLKTNKQTKDHILHSSFLFFQTTPSTATLSNQQGYTLSMVPKGLAKCKIKCSLSVIFFFFNHVPSMTPALCTGSIWTHWKEFPEWLWVTSSANSFFPSATEGKIVPMLLPSEKQKKPSVFYLKKTKSKKASEMDSEGFCLDL